MKLRIICKSKIHHANVTGADLNYIGSIGIDRTLITSIALHQGIPHDRDYWRLKDLDSLAEHGGWRAAQALVDRWRGGEIRAVEALRQVQAAGSRREPQALQRRAAIRDTAARRA